MSGTSAFLRGSCWKKSDSKTPVSTLSNIEACEFECLIPGQDKSLSTKDSALAKSFLLMSSLSESFLYVGFAQLDTLEAPAL